MSKWVVDIHGDIEGDYEIIGKYESETKTAKWITDDFTGLIICSNCKGDAPISTISGEQYESYYCPNCGAEMRSEDKK